VVNEFPQAWELVCQADMPNLGLGFDSYHMFATNTSLDELDILDPDRIFLVQLADFMWTEIKSVEERIATARVQEVREAATAAGLSVEAHTVEALHPWEAIIEHARRHECDLIVMASHGRRGVSALLLGSETQKVLTHSKVPVLVVR
jgi:nucleotide-binding universal stress UspA family protein